MKKILLLAAVAIGIAGPAHAGPVAAAVAWVGSTMAAGGVAGALLRIAVGIGSQLLAGVLGKAMAEKPKVSVQFDVEFGDDTPLALVVGDHATAGKRKYLSSWGKNSRYITEVIEVSCLPQPGLAAMWVNDEAGRVLWGETDSDGTGHNLGHPVTNLDDDGHRIWVRWVNGMQTAADPMLVALFGGDPDYPWTSDMIGTGKSYVIVTTRYDSDTLTSYPTYLWQPEPLPMYDPRKDGSTGGTGSHRWGNRSTYEPTRNAAVIAYNVGRGIYYGSEWIFGGKNLPAWRLPRAEWVAAMTACDRAIALAGGGSEPAFRAGLEIRAEVTAADVLEELGRAANMRFAEVGGMLKPIVGIPGAAVFAFTDGDILISEGQSYKPFDSLSATYNALSATYPEPAEKWSTKDAPEYVDAAFTAADGGRYLPTSIAYPAAPFRNQVQRLMRAQMRDYRRFRTHQFYLPPDAYGLEPLVDVVSWTSERNGYVNKLFVVESVSKTPGMKVAVSLREVDPSDYDWSSDFELPTSIVTPAPVRPWVQAVAGFGAEAVIVTDNATKARSVAIRATCGGDEVGVTHIRLQVRKSSEADASIDVQRPYGAPYAWLIHSVNQRTTYQVRGLLMSELTPKGAWSGWITVTTGSVYVDDSDFVGGVTGLFQGAGMKPTRDIPNRSTPGAYLDELAWSRADNRLYRWNGTAWVHFIQESVNGILDETAFAANIRIPKTVTQFPTSGQRLGDLVILTTDRQQYRWDGTKWTAEVLADQIVGKLTAMQIGANAIGAEQVAARALSARHLVVSDFTNLVPDDQLQDRLSWAITNPNAAEFRDSGELAIKPQSLGYIRFSGGLSGGTFSRAHSGEFPVEGNEEFFCQGEAWRQSGSAPNSGITFHVQFRDGDGNWMVPDQRFYYRYLTAEGLQSGAQVQSGSVVAPANARAARIYISMLAGTDGNWIAASPLVRRKFGGKMVIDGDLEARHIKFETLTGGLMAPTGIITKSAQIDDLVVTRAKIANLAVDNAKIGNLAVNTIKVADGAITATFVVEPANVGANDLSGSYRTIATLTLNLAYPAGVVLGGGGLMLNSSTSSGGLNLRAQVNGVTVRGSEYLSLPSISQERYSSFIYAANLPAGTVTITLQAQANGSTAGKGVTDMFLYALRAYK